MTKSAAARIRPDDLGTTTLSDSLSFAIYSADLALGKAYKPILDDLGLTFTEYITIIALWEEDDLTVDSLGKKLFLESGMLTPILDELEIRGYLRRQRDPEDERQVRASLTEAGYQLREQSLNTKLIEVNSMPPHELSQLQTVIVAMRDNLLTSIKRK